MTAPNQLLALAARVVELEAEVKDLRTAAVLLQQASLASEARATALLEALKQMGRAVFDAAAPTDALRKAAEVMLAALKSREGGE